MFPKPSPITLTISLFFGLFFLNVTSSSATISNCPDFKTVAAALRHYDLPTGLFPDYVKSFSCQRDSVNSHKLSVQLYGHCTVTRSLFAVKNIVECEPQMAATVSYHQLSDIKGITVTLFVNGGIVGEVMQVTDVRAVGIGFAKFLQFDSDKGPSPWFPYLDIAQEPPKCDNTLGLQIIPKLVLGA
ncbi:unnamed protein product [Amaranthus hypochondriacus]